MPVTCPDCGNWLGVLTTEGLESRHRRRRWIIRDATVTCEKCGGEIRVVDGRVVQMMELATA
jgi:hypothetical protein